MIHLIGAGGHAKVVLDALLEGGRDPSEIRVRDGRAVAAAFDLLGFPVEGPEIVAALDGEDFHVAVGSAAVRESLCDAAEAAGATACAVVHPDAVVSQFADIHAGAFVAATAVVGPSARVGRGVIVNHGAVVDHDCTVGDFSHVAPNATLGGGVSVGARCLIGSGAVVLPGVRIGDGATIGAGAVVTQPIPSHQTWTGVPAAPKAPE